MLVKLPVSLGAARRGAAVCVVAFDRCLVLPEIGSGALPLQHARASLLAFLLQRSTLCGARQMGAASRFGFPLAD